MNGLDEEQMAPQNFLYGCVLESTKEVMFNPEGDSFEHQLDLRMACVDPSTKDELHMVEVEGLDLEGQKVKATLVSLKPSTMPSVCLGGFTIAPPAVFRLKAGSGPIHLSGQHLVIMEPDQSFDEDDDDEEEFLKTSKKRPAASPALKSQKKMKLVEAEADEDDDEDDEDDDEDDDDEDDEDEDDEDGEEEEGSSPVKMEDTPVKAEAAVKAKPYKPGPASRKVPPQNGKSPKAATPAPKEAKTPKGGKTPKTPQTTPKTAQTPKTALTVPEIQAKIKEALSKGISLPKAQPKFENFVKHSYRVSDTKVITELWKWRQTVTDPKEAK